MSGGHFATIAPSTAAAAGPPPLPVRRAAEIEPPLDEGSRWLVERLWPRSGVGMLAGPPKVSKTWLALELAVAVASGTPALGRFAVSECGSVLLLCAEDSPPSVRERLAALASARAVELGELDIYVVLVSSLRLEEARDQKRLADAVARFRPSLLVLDPFIRLHRVSENDSHEVSGVLGWLRQLQQEQSVAILVVHHARKAAGPENAGVELRGSGDLRAWSDTNLYLRRRRRAEGAADGELLLSVEHRSAPAPDAIGLRLASEPSPHLQLVDRNLEDRAAAAHGDERDPLLAEVIAVLVQAGAPLSQDDIRRQVRARNGRVIDALRALGRDGLVEREGRHWKLVSQVEREGGTKS